MVKTTPSPSSKNFSGENAKKVSVSLNVPSRSSKGRVTPTSEVRKETSHNSPYRCTLLAFVKLVNKVRAKLTDEHVEVLKLSPFWRIINAVMLGQIDLQRVRKYGSDITRIIDCYDKEKQHFDFGAFTARPECVDVKLILGVNDGDKQLDLGAYKPTNFLMRCFPEKYNNEECFDKNGTKKVLRLTPGLISEKLELVIMKNGAEDLMDVGRLLTLHLLATFIVPSEATYFGWRYTTVVDQFSELREYNWSALILDVLLNGLHGNGKIPKEVRYPGCSMFLIYWLCEKTTIMNPIYDHRVPRFMKWSLSEVHDRLKSLNLRELRNDDFRENHINGSEHEMSYITMAHEDEANSQFVDYCDRNVDGACEAFVKVNEDNHTKIVAYSDSDDDQTSPPGRFFAGTSSEAVVACSDSENATPICSRPSYSLGFGFSSPDFKFSENIISRLASPVLPPSSHDSPTEMVTPSSEKMPGMANATSTFVDEDFSPITGQLMELNAELVESKSISAKKLQQKDSELMGLRAQVEELLLQKEKLTKENDELKAKLNQATMVAEQKEADEDDVAAESTLIEEEFGKRKRVQKQDPDFTDATKRKPRKLEVATASESIIQVDDDDYFVGNVGQPKKQTKFTVPKYNTVTPDEFGIEFLKKIKSSQEILENIETQFLGSLDQIKRDAIEKFKLSEEFLDWNDKIRKHAIKTFKYSDEFLESCERIRKDAIERFKSSDEFLQSLNQIRRVAVESFKTSNEFLDLRDNTRKEAIEVFRCSNEFREETVKHYVNGFEACRIQLSNCGELPKGFNLDFLDVAGPWGKHPGQVHDGTIGALTRVKSIKSER